MKYIEWLKDYDKSHITHPSRQDVWDGAWDYQQDRIDAVKKQLLDMQKKLESIKIDDIRPRHSEYDHGWRDCAITVLSDLEELLK